jgi:hypothetical protein
MRRMEAPSIFGPSSSGLIHQVPLCIDIVFLRGKRDRCMRGPLVALVHNIMNGILIDQGIPNSRRFPGIFSVGLRYPKLVSIFLLRI